MFSSKIAASLALATLLGVLLVLTHSSARAFPSPDALNLDHFWCYNTDGDPINEPVDLKDQFNPITVTKTVGKPKLFCNPAQKKHGDRVFKIIDPNAHLTFYEIDTPTAELIRVAVKNQFGRSQLKVYQPALYLATPTKKDNLPEPTALDHFKCYQVKGRALNVPVGLKDQWHRSKNLVVGKPVLLCAPTSKVHRDKTFEIQHPKAHLVCYRLPEKQFTRVPLATDQFTSRQLVVNNPNLLCVPSTKTVLE